MPPGGCQASRSDPVGHGIADPGTAWPRPTGSVEGGVLCRWVDAHRGNWDRTGRPCPRTCPRHSPDHRRGPSLPPRCSSRRSAVLRPPRTPAAHASLSPSAYTSAPAPTRAAQTGLSCSVRLRARVLRPLPRRDPTHVRPRTGVRGTWPSPRHDRLGSRVVNVSRLQASRQVAARVLASSVEALDAPLGPHSSRHTPGACYSALRGLPRRDLHPREMDSGKPAQTGWLRHDAPWPHYMRQPSPQRRAARAGPCVRPCAEPPRGRGAGRGPAKRPPSGRGTRPLRRPRGGPVSSCWRTSAGPAAAEKRYWTNPGNAIKFSRWILLSQSNPKERA